MKRNTTTTKPPKTKPTKKIRKGDKVMAITGNDKGQVGTVITMKGNKAVVQGINVRKKHIKRSQENQQGGIIEIEKPIDLSNLMVCDATNKPIKLKKRQKKGKDKELVYTDGKKEVSYRSVKKS